MPASEKLFSIILMSRSLTPRSVITPRQLRATMSLSPFAISRARSGFTPSDGPAATAFSSVASRPILLKNSA